MRSSCPDHGDAVRPFLADKRFHVAVEPFIDRANERRAPDEWGGTYDHVHLSRDLYIDLTERCNFHCPICYTNADGRGPTADLTREEIFAGIDRLPPGVVVSLLGGEPTLREDLPEIVRYVVRRGHVLKLITNGSLLTDERIAELRDAGLRWVILQFDGFSDEAYVRLRGRPLLAQKLAVIDRLARHGMIIVLASMIVPGVNDDQVGRILHFALCHPRIVQIGFLPASDIGRNRIGQGPGELETPAFIDLLAAQTGGRIGLADFVRNVRLGHAYTRLTGNLAYKARTCCNGLFLYHEGYSGEDAARSWTEPDPAALHAGKTLEPVDRALASGRWLRHPGRVAGALKTIAGWNRAPVHPNLFGIVIEKFRSRAALDFDDAKNCTKVYLTRDGFIPNCVYNILYRPGRADG